jgi:hypothetical protein
VRAPRSCPCTAFALGCCATPRHCRATQSQARAVQPLWGMGEHDNRAISARSPQTLRLSKGYLSVQCWTGRKGRKSAPLREAAFQHETFCSLLSSLKRHLRIRMAELCYDTQHVEAVTFPVGVPDKTPRTLSSDFIRKNFRINHLLRGICGTVSLYRHFSRKKSGVNRCSAADTDRAARHPTSGRPRSRGGV